jgi:two-component system sensor kinase FixL
VRGDVQPINADFLAIAEAAPFGVLAISRDGLIRFVNRATLRIFGYAEEALLGQPVELLLPPELQTSHPELRAEFFASSTVRDLTEGGEIIGRCLDGRQVPVEITLGSTGSGDTMHAVAFINDVSCRTRSEERFEAIIAALPIGLAMVDAAGKIQITNRMLETMFGYEPNELLGRNFEVLLPPRDRAGHPALREDYALVLKSRAMGAGWDLVGLHRSGKEFPVEIALSRIKHRDGFGSVALITDISIRKKLEHALQQANAHLEEYTYIASHDLRSPLRGIADLLEWIEEDLDPAQITEAVAKNFCRARQRISRAERMTDDLLTYARASAHNTQKETVDPRALLEEILEDTTVPAGFEVTIESEVGTFITHKIPLQTALRNLLDNALKHHGGTSGRIRCSVREAGRFYVFTVDDDGQGVPELARTKIFKLFHRASSTTEGHGIGLSVTRRKVASHGGELVLEEQSALGGASFSIYWPQFETRDDE